MKVAKWKIELREQKIKQAAKDISNISQKYSREMKRLRRIINKNKEEIEGFKEFEKRGFLATESMKSFDRSRERELEEEQKE